ncbi:MAG TPA: hypothetical protein VML91_03125 [Burkholderiales bacterium]|nr:hypothetical protein [Burkholderiales bacterium]
MTATAPGGFGLAVRLPLLVLGFASLVLGVGSGLARAGFGVPLPDPGLPAWHGALMVGGFFGTVISLERAVALGTRSAYAAPLLAGAGGLALNAVATPAPAQWLLAAAGVLLAIESSAICARQRALFTFTLALGAASWAIGNAAWLAGASFGAVAPWWIAFLVLTIAGERLELTRLLPPSPARERLFAGIVVGVLAGAALALLDGEGGRRILGIALLALAAWLGVQDIARRTAREPGLTGYIGRCLLAGYVWLAIGGALLAGPGATYGGFGWDAAVHAILLGFVFSMVFGHAPLIVPAIARTNVPYHWSFYVPLVLLHLSIAVRVSGDVAGLVLFSMSGAVLNAIAIVVFVASTLTAVVRGRRAAGEPRAQA